MLLSCPSVQAVLDAEMEALFNGMINTTPGEAYMTQRRGVITGGNIVMRNKMVNPNLISFVPPGVKTGCGGINLFGGSFSFINGAQLTQLMRSIAQASVGYAFNLAIEGMCPTCAQVMTKLQKDVQTINNLMRNSCDAAKAIVDSTIGPSLQLVNEKSKNELSSDLSTDAGFLTDFFGVKEGSSKSPAQQAIEAGKANLIKGNVVYESLNHADTTSWFANGDEQMKGVMMSLTGTYISSPNPDNTDIQYVFREPKIGVREFIEGGNIRIYQCESNDCLLPGSGDANTETINITGMRARVRKMLFGTGICAACTGGIVRKLHERVGGQALDISEQKFIEASSPGVQGLLSHVATEPQSAALIADRLIDTLAVELSNQIVDEMFDAVSNSIVASGKELDTTMQGVMRDRRAQINEERRKAGESLASIAYVLDLHRNVEQNLRDTAYHRTQ
jgi:conjugative transfer pilus assembly protein TraH